MLQNCKTNYYLFRSESSDIVSQWFTEAGGVATDAVGNNLDFSKGRHLDLDTGIIVTNKKLMPALLKAVQDAVKEKSQSSASLLQPV